MLTQREDSRVQVWYSRYPIRGRYVSIHCRCVLLGVRTQIRSGEEDRSDVQMCPPMIVLRIALYTGFHFALSPWS